jgi:toxin secretion/phage lysis holin
VGELTVVKFQIQPPAFGPVELAGMAIGAVTGVLVGLGPFFQALLVAMGADVLTGIIAAGSLGEISSRKADLGLQRKAATIVIVLAVGWIAETVGQQLGIPLPGGQAMAGAFIIRELFSLLENAKRTGMDIGPFAKFLAIAQPQVAPPPTPAPPTPDPVAEILQAIDDLNKPDKAALAQRMAELGDGQQAGP